MSADLTDQALEKPKIVQLRLIDENPILCQEWRKAFSELLNVKIENNYLENLPEVDCLVIPSDSFGSFSGGISRQISQLFKKEGVTLPASHNPHLLTRLFSRTNHDLHYRVREKILSEYDGSQPVGTCLLMKTNSPHLPFIAHVPTMPFIMDISRTSNAFTAFSSVFQEIARYNQTSELKIKSVASPGLGSGSGALAPLITARQMAEAYRRYFLSAIQAGALVGNLTSENLLVILKPISWPTPANLNRDTTILYDSLSEPPKGSDFLVSKPRAKTSFTPKILFELDDYPKPEKMNIVIPKISKPLLLQTFHHDACNYIQIILGRIDALAAKPHHLNAHITALKATSNLLMRLIDDVNNYELITSGKIELPLTAIDLFKVIKGSAAQLQLKLKQARIRCLLPKLTKHQQKRAWVLGNAFALDRVFFNIIHNAIKYSPTRSTITITFGTTDKSNPPHLSVYISDQGCGLHTENWKKVFTPNFQVDSRSEGHGLGLTIAQGLLALMGGEVGVQHSEIGKGTTFYIRLPK